MHPSAVLINRSLSLGTSLYAAIKKSAADNRRTISQQICHLFEVGLQQDKQFINQVPLAESGGRAYLYIDPELDAQVLAVQETLKADSYSAGARALLTAGLMAERVRRRRLKNE